MAVIARRVSADRWLPAHFLHHASRKGPPMSDIWQTIEQAAVTLGLSVRTVNRHITAGKLDSRLFEGRREVRIPSSANFGSAMPSVGATSARFNGQSSVATDTTTDTRHAGIGTNG